MNYLLYFVVGVAITLLLFLGWGSLKRSEKGFVQKGNRTSYTQQVTSPMQVSSLVDKALEKGRAYLKQGEFDKALFAYKEAEKLATLSGKDGDKGITMMMQDILEYGDFRLACRWCEDYFDKHPEDRNPEAMLALSDIYNQAARYEQAETTLKSVLTADSVGKKDKFERLPYLDYVTYCINEATFDSKSDRKSLLSEASKYLNSYLKLYGEDSIYYKSLAEFFLVQDDFKTAIEHYKKAIKEAFLAEEKGSDQRLKFGVVEANFVIALLDMWSGNLDEAREHFNAGFAQYNKLSDSDTDRFIIWREVMLLGNEMYLGGDKVTSADMEKIAREVEGLEAKGFHQDRFHKNARKDLGEFITNREKGDYAAAIKSLDKVISAFENTYHGCPDYYVVRPYNLAMLHNYKGDMYMKLGDKEKAQEAYEKAKKAAPMDKVATQRLSML